MATEPSEKREYITTPQASELANLSANYIATLLRKKRLEGFQLGRDWFVYTDSLNQFLQTTRKPGPRGPRKPPFRGDIGDTDHSNHQNQER